MNLDKNYYKYEDNEVIQFKRGTSLALRRRNPVLLEGQPCIELDTLKFKIGDGKSKYNQLPYINKTNSGEGGADGLSAYEIWLELGNSGTEQNFIDSLKGESAFEIWKKETGNINAKEEDYIKAMQTLTWGSF